MGASTLILLPLTFVSSAFAPPGTMPTWVREFVTVNPVTLLVDAARSLLDGVPDAGDIALVLALSGVTTIVFAPLALWLYNRKVRLSPVVGGDSSVVCGVLSRVHSPHPPSRHRALLIGEHRRLRLRTLSTHRLTGKEFAQDLTMNHRSAGHQVKASGWGVFVR
ncbi:ABC transporter permease [Streptosporangium sp. NPDC050280]|uniref:ABC transporter permease n=1 Tax=unclassified Streptosporangium TaxID=2632669 RepID=UPI00341AB433